MAQQTISSNKPPIVWSTVDEAFQKINSNFTELYLSIGGSGVDLTNISSSLIPDTNLVRDLGSNNKRWRDLYLSGDSLYLGDAVITTSIGGAVNLPAGSTVGGDLIRNPSESSFKTISVTGQSNVTANDFQGILNLTGSGITITTDSNTDTITFTNSGITDVQASTGILVNKINGVVSVANDGVTSLTATTGISVSSSKGAITIGNTGVREIVAGTGININTSTGVVTITNIAPNVAQNVYRFISVQGQLTLDPAGPTSVLNVAKGNGIDITTNPLNSTLTIANTGVTGIAVGSGLTLSAGTGSVLLSLDPVLQRNIDGDLTGSVFSESSTVLVDATNGIIKGDVINDSIITGSVSGNDSNLQITAYTGGAVTISNDISSISIPAASAIGISSSSGIGLVGTSGAAITIGNSTSGNVTVGNGSNQLILTTGSKFVTRVEDLQIAGGFAGQVLTTDGAGNHTWSFPAGGVSGGGGTGASYAFKVAAEDSTQRLIASGETLQFVGSNGISTSADAEGKITISGAGIFGLLARNTASATTGSIANNASANISITGFKGYVLYKIQTSAAAWVRLYTSTSARTSDASRTEGIDPLPGAGVIAEVVTTGAETIVMSPAVIGFNDNSPVDTIIPVAVTNKSGSTTDITVTVTIIRLEP